MTMMNHQQSLRTVINGHGFQEEVSGKRRYLKGTSTLTTAEACVEYSDDGSVTVVADDACKNALLLQPILVGLFFIVIFYCCWKKSRNDISDSYWCCCKKSRRKRQEREREAAIDSTIASVASSSPVIVESTRHEREQREEQQRQLPIQASLRRRERELHRIWLETNARLEKMKGRLEAEKQARRVILNEKFQLARLEKTLTADDFISSTAEGCTSQGDETNDRTSRDEIHTEGQPFDRSDAEGKQQHHSPNDNIEEATEENPPYEPASQLRVRWDREQERCRGDRPSTGESSMASFPNECAICLQEYQPGEAIVVSDNPSCKHCYHRDCIVEYLIPLFDLEGGEDRNDDADNNGGTMPLPPSPSTTLSGALCPCCRQPFLLDPPRIEDSGSFLSLSPAPSLHQ